MTNIWVLEHIERVYDRNEENIESILGVFSSLKKAQKAAQKREPKNTTLNWEHFSDGDISVELPYDSLYICTKIELNTLI